MFYSVKSFREVYCGDVPWYTPLATSLLQHPVHHQVVFSTVGWAESVAFLVNDLDMNLAPTPRREVFTSYYFSEDFSDFFRRPVTTIFELFSSHSTAVFCFSFLEAVDSIMDLAFCNLWNGVELIRHSFFFLSSVRDFAFCFIVVFFTIFAIV